MSKTVAPNSRRAAAHFPVLVILAFVGVSAVTMQWVISAILAIPR